MQSIAENDLGTPPSTSALQVRLQIDGCEVTVPAGTSVMRAAALADLKIPKLCATDQLEAFGSCRLCVVQIEGVKGVPVACTAPVAAGMKVSTQNAELARLRRGVMELYISDRPLDCLTCPANGHCELQDMAGAVGLREVRYGYTGANHVYAEAQALNAGWPVRNANGHAHPHPGVNPLFAPKDESTPYFTFDPSKC